MNFFYKGIIFSLWFSWALSYWYAFNLWFGIDHGTTCQIYESICIRDGGYSWGSASFFTVIWGIAAVGIFFLWAELHKIGKRNAAKVAQDR